MDSLCPRTLRGSKSRQGDGIEEVYKEKKKMEEYKETLVDIFDRAISMADRFKKEIEKNVENVLFNLELYIEIWEVNDLGDFKNWERQILFEFVKQSSPRWMKDYEMSHICISNILRDLREVTANPSFFSVDADAEVSRSFLLGSPVPATFQIIRDESASGGFTVATMADEERCVCTIGGVTPNGPANRAGLEIEHVGWHITHVDGVSVTGPSCHRALDVTRSAGRSFTLSIRRPGFGELTNDDAGVGRVNLVPTFGANGDFNLSIEQQNSPTVYEDSSVDTAAQNSAREDVSSVDAEDQEVFFVNADAQNSPAVYEVVSVDAVAQDSARDKVFSVDTHAHKVSSVNAETQNSPVAHEDLSVDAVAQDSARDKVFSVDAGAQKAFSVDAVAQDSAKDKVFTVDAMAQDYAGDKMFSEDAGAQTGFSVDAVAQDSARGNIFTMEERNALTRMHIACLRVDPGKGSSVDAGAQKTFSVDAVAQDPARDNIFSVNAEAQTCYFGDAEAQDSARDKVFTMEERNALTKMHIACLRVDPGKVFSVDAGDQKAFSVDAVAQDSARDICFTSRNLVTGTDVFREQWQTDFCEQVRAAIFDVRIMEERNALTRMHIACLSVDPG